MVCFILIVNCIFWGFSFSLQLAKHCCYCWKSGVNFWWGFPGVYIHRGTYRTNVLSHTKLIGQLSSSQQNVTDISHQWNHSKLKGRLNCCVSVHLHLSVIKYITNNRLIKEQWRTNQLINQQTNNTDVKPFRNWCTMNEWLTDCEYLNLLYFTLWALQTSSKKVVKYLLKKSYL